MSTTDYITPNQLANMLDKRARELRDILARVDKLEDTEDHLAAALSLGEAVDSIDEAARCLRGNPSPGYGDHLKSEAQRAMEAHQPGLPPGGGQPDLFT